MISQEPAKTHNCKSNFKKLTPIDSSAGSSPNREKAGSMQTPAKEKQSQNSGEQARKNASAEDQSLEKRLTSLRQRETLEKMQLSTDKQIAQIQEVLIQTNDRKKEILLSSEQHKQLQTAPQFCQASAFDSCENLLNETHTDNMEHFKTAAAAVHLSDPNNASEPQTDSIAPKAGEKTKESPKKETSKASKGEKHKSSSNE